MSLANKTLFVTGGSRGIGLAIALRAARDGANIAIAAKTVKPDPRLPGTIFTATEEIEKAGGKALPLACDIRDEQSVDKAVAETVAKFGGIDILVNNASAISLTGTLATPMKRYDLMHQINARGTFMVSQKCIPHLLKAANPHVLNLSPPLDFDVKWFANHPAYTLAKYGMSVFAWSMAERASGLASASAGLRDMPTILLFAFVMAVSPSISTPSANFATNCTFSQVTGMTCPRMARMLLASRTALPKSPSRLVMAAINKLPKLWPEISPPSSKRNWKSLDKRLSERDKATMQFRTSPGGRI